MAPSSRKRSSANAGSTPYARNTNSSRMVSSRASAGSGGNATNPPETPVGNSIFTSLLRVLSTPLTLLSSSSNLEERNSDDSDRDDGSEFDDEEPQQVGTIPKHVAADHDSIPESPTPADQSHVRTTNKSTFNSLLNHPAVSPIPSSSSQSVLENLANTPFGSAYSPATSTAQKNSNASPSKYDDIMSLLSRKGDQPLSVSEAQTLQNLIRKNMEVTDRDRQTLETPLKSRSSAENDPFRQSIALNLSDLSPSVDAKESSHAGSAPAPLFTFGAATSTVTSAASLFGPSKPMFAPVFTFKSQAPQNASLAAQSRSIFSAASDQMAASESSALQKPQQNRPILRRRPTELRSTAPLYQGASFGVVTPLRKRVSAVGTRPSLRQPQPASQEAFGAEPHSKRHRLDGDDDNAEDDSFKKRARRDAGESSATDNNIENDAWTQGATSSDSASKLILETLEDMAPPPTNLLSLAPDFSFTNSPASMPPVVIHQSPKPSSGPKILATTRKVEAAITGTSAKPKSALVNARISQLVQFPIRPTVGGTPSRPSNKNTGKLKATEPLPAGETPIQQRAAFPMESKQPQKSDIVTPHPVATTPSTSRTQEMAVTVPETTAKASAPAIPSSVKSARFGFGIPATPVAATAINSVHEDSKAVTTAAYPTSSFTFGTNFAEKSNSVLLPSAVNDLKTVNRVDLASETGQSPGQLNATFETQGKVWDEVKLLTVSVLPIFKFENDDSSLTHISKILMSQYPDILRAIPAIQKDDLAKYSWVPLSTGPAADKSEPMDVIPSMPGGFNFASSPSKGGFSFAKPATAGFSLGFASTKVTESAQKPSEWVCDKCLVVNDNAQTKCIACEAAKDGGTAVSAVPKNWVCDTCLVENEQTAQICIACESGRSAEVKKKSSLRG
ncbi:hypothetical protein HDU81_001021 [Chytriomyces hyalinus]|nr:hypothetical protein HDU81_001021 [Chytriomyces hyalinus]